MQLNALIPLIGILVGTTATVIVVTKSLTAAQPPSAPPTEPAASPFASSIAGTGLVEPSSESLLIASELSGVVVDVRVVPGQRVDKGDVLFRLDDRDVAARLAVAVAERAAAEARWERARAAPRAETIPPARATLAEAMGQLAVIDNEIDRLGKASDARAVAAIELERQQLARLSAVARVDRARSDLDLLLAGTWQPELAERAAELRIAEAKVRQLETERQRLTVRSPIAGQVLERNIRPGQYAEARAGTDAPIVLGSTEVLHVRVDIDETEAWRYTPGSPAIALVRGNPALTAKLAFVRAEPSIAPKRSLTGASTERTDTRVLRVIYALDPASLPVCVGQLLDIRVDGGGAGAITADGPPRER